MMLHSELFGKKLLESDFEIIDYFLKNNNKPTYKAEIERNIEYSKQTAGERCEKLYKWEIFNRKKKKIETKYRKEGFMHYFIRGHPDVYSKLLYEYLNNPDINKKLLFMSSKYAQKQLIWWGEGGELLGQFFAMKIDQDTELADWFKTHFWDIIKTNPDSIWTEEQMKIYLDIIKISPTALYHFYFQEIYKDDFDMKTYVYKKPLDKIITAITIKDDLIINSNQPKIIQSFHRYIFKLSISCMYSDILRYPELTNDEDIKRIVNRILKETNRGRISPIRTSSPQKQDTERF